MKLDELAALFEKHEEEYLQFDRIAVEDRLSSRKDVHAFLLLEKILPPSDSDGDILACAEHDQVWLDASGECLAEVISEDQVIALRRCGVSFDRDNEALYMFV
jgi:hypothetical protein